MDNFTHSLTGWALGQTGLKTRSRKGLAALILGANLPDIDVLFSWVSWPPLAMHRGFTHGVGGLVLLPPFLAGLLWLLDRWQVRRGESFASGLEMRFGWLVALAYIGALSHPLLDLQNTYAVQLLSPFDHGWFHNDALFIIDGWLWSGLAFALWLSRRREKRGGAWRRPAQVALAAMVAYIAASAALSVAARQAIFAAGVARNPEVVVAGPPPVLFWRRDLVWREEGLLRRAKFAPLAGLTNVSEPAPDGMADPLVRRAMTANRAIITFLQWSIIPTARVERGRCAATVIFGDARYGDARARASFERRVTLSLCPDGANGPRRDPRG